MTREYQELEFDWKLGLIIVMSTIIFFYILVPAFYAPFQKICKDKLGTDWRASGVQVEYNSVLCVTEKEFCETSTDNTTNCYTKTIFKTTELNRGVFDDF